MKAILIKKMPPKQSSKGGLYVRCTFKSCDDNKSYMLDVYERHWKSKKFWETGLPLQGIYSNLSIFREKYIDGTSNFNFHGVKKPIGEDIWWNPPGHETPEQLAFELENK